MIRQINPVKVPSSIVVMAKSTTKIVEKLKAEVGRSILLEDREKEFWIKNCETMPLTLIVFFHSYLKKQNALVDSYIKKAIDDHPELVAEIKAKTRKIKNALSGLHGAEDEKAAEKLLEEQIKQI